MAEPEATNPPLRRRWFAWAAVVVAGIVVVAFLAVSEYRISHRREHFAAIRKRVWVTRVANDSTDPITAPNFTLTDQRGRRISLDQFRGKVVVLQFMDPRCTDICPLVAQEIVGAQAQLGGARGKVVFLAVNVNAAHHQVADVRAFTKAHGLSHLADFHFLTGAPGQLKAVWKAFGIAVVPTASGDVQHASVVYFIGPAGRERYLGHPSDRKASIADWAAALAYYARKTL